MFHCSTLFGHPNCQQRAVPAVAAAAVKEQLTDVCRYTIIS